MSAAWDDGAEEALASLRGASKRVQRFPVTWIEDFQLSTQNTDLLDGIVPSGGFVLVYGPSGDGKTFWTIDVAYHIAEGIKWRGRFAKGKSLVIYVAAEAGTSIAKRFIAKAADRRPDDEGCTLGVITRAVNLLEMTDVEFLIGELKQLAGDCNMPLDLVIFDTYSRSIPGGDENGPKDSTAAIGAADRIRDQTGATTLFVHHSGKDSDKGPRGFSGLYAAADTVIRVVDKVAEVEKSRDGPGQERFPFGLRVVELGTDQNGKPVTTCLVDQADDQPLAHKAKALPANASTAFMALREAVQEKGLRLPASSSIPYPVSAVSLSTWRDQFKLRYGGDEPEAFKKAFQRAKQDLLKQGLIQISDPNVWIV